MPIADPMTAGAAADRLLDDLRRGPLAGLPSGAAVLRVPAAAGVAPIAADDSAAAILAPRRLQDVADYRATLQRWFRALRVGGWLIVTVPHAFLHERQLALPARWRPDQPRLYTPASLLAEVEEALVPNSYRVRWLGDRDAGYDYALDRATPPVGEADVVLVIERVAPPAWGLEDAAAAARPGPDYAFEPDVTRIEAVGLAPALRILILKLDHLGDFIMGMPALERMRAIFPEADITLVVGTWNAAIAGEMAVADRVLTFDAFPRNSSEAEVDVHGKRSLFQALVTDDYDLAVDLRTDDDTRFLLRDVRAGLRAGIGGGGDFPFLDIFLPTGTQHAFETARDEVIGPARFSSQDGVSRSHHRLGYTGGARAGSAIVWGPYLRLRPGRYIFEPFIEMAAGDGGLLLYDVALDTRQITYIAAPRPSGGGEPARLHFAVERADTAFEFRIWPAGDAPVPDFSFYGGRLIYEGARSTLHQSEYLILLVELIAMRGRRFGLFGPVS